MPKFTDVYFDCDSTLIGVESLDWLAERRGIGAEVRQLTEASMNGEIPLEKVLKRKMDLIAPSQALVAEFVREIPRLLVSGAKELVAELNARGCCVHMLTSNFHPLVDPVAEACGISRGNVHAGQLFFNEAGAYAGIDEDSPLCHSHGKPTVLCQQKKEGQRCVMIGDGSTDLACKGVVDLFIGFGGVAVREKVAREADIYVREPNLLAVLPYLEGTSEKWIDFR